MSFCLNHTFDMGRSSEKHRKTQSIIWVHSATTSQSCDFLLNLVVSDTLWDPGRGSAGVFQSIRLLFTRIGKFEPPLLSVQRPVPLCTQCLIPQKWVQTVALFMPLFPQSFPFSSIALVPFIYFCTIVTLTTIYLITFYHFIRLED